MNLTNEQIEGLLFAAEFAMEQFDEADTMRGLCEAKDFKLAMTVYAMHLSWLSSALVQLDSAALAQRAAELADRCREELQRVEQAAALQSQLFDPQEVKQ
jgi:exonuclease VII small subunit